MPTVASTGKGRLEQEEKKTHTQSVCLLTWNCGEDILRCRLLPGCGATRAWGWCSTCFVDSSLLTLCLVVSARVLNSLDLGGIPLFWLDRWFSQCWYESGEELSICKQAKKYCFIIVLQPNDVRVSRHVFLCTIFGTETWKTRFIKKILVVSL